MKTAIEYIKKSLAMTIPVSAILFLISGSIIDINHGGSFVLENYSFTKMAIGTFVIGLGFGLPCFVYASDKLSPLFKSLIHMAVGCTVMILVGLFVGWIPVDKGLSKALIIILSEIALAALIWVFSYFRYKKMAKEMNERIQKMKE